MSGKCIDAALFCRVAFYWIVLSPFRTLFYKFVIVMQRASILSLRSANFPVVPMLFPFDHAFSGGGASKSISESSFLHYLVNYFSYRDKIWIIIFLDFFLCFIGSIFFRIDFYF